jgi:hypothetical protein
MVITPRDTASEGFLTADWLSRFEPRTLEDIRAFGRNSPADDRAFAAVARLSERNLAMYRAFVQPWVRMLATEKVAEIAHALNPLRLSYTMFADTNPWMRGVQGLAELATASRRQVGADNPFLQAQGRISDRITAGLEAFRVSRDQRTEQMFFALYGSPLVQAFLGLDASGVVRPAPPPTAPSVLAQGRLRAASNAGKLLSGGYDEALVRAVFFVIGADGPIDHRGAHALGNVRGRFLGLSIAAFKKLVQEQVAILALEPIRAVYALAGMVPQPDARRKLLDQVEAIVTAGGPANAATSERLAHLAKSLGGVGKPGASHEAVTDRPAGADAAAE